MMLKFYLNNKYGCIYLDKIKRSTCLCLFVFSLLQASFLSAQNSTLYFSAQSLKAVEVLESLEEKLNIQLNYNHNILPKGQFSFSCKGNLQQILNTSCSVLNRNYAQLDQGVFVIQDKAIDLKNKVDPISLNGFIKDAYKLPVVGATVWISSINVATQSNAEGAFELEGYFDKKEMIQIRFLGYETIRISIADFFNLNSKTLFLKTKSHILSDIEVIEYISGRRQSSNQDDVLNIEKMAPVAGRNDKDALAAIQLLPGISTASENLSETQIRGGLPDQTNYTWNGIRLFQTSHFFGKISAVNPFMVNQIKVTRNGGSAKDSGAISGGIALSNKNASDSLSVKTYVDLLYTNIGLSTPLANNKVHVDAAWRKSYFNLHKGFIFDRFFEQTFQFGRIPIESYFQDFFNVSEFISLRPEMDFQDLTFSINYQPTKKDAFNFSWLNLRNDLRYIKESSDETVLAADSLQVKNSGYHFSYQRDWAEKLKSKVNWTKSEFGSNYSHTASNDTLLISNKEIQFNQVEEETFQINNSIDLKK